LNVLPHLARPHYECADLASVDAGVCDASGDAMNTIASVYGEDHVNTRYIRQLPKGIAPLIAMRKTVCSSSRRTFW
jgi:hypothetical protein